MSRYYCPFCSLQYQLYKKTSDGVLICGHCGDPLIKKNIVNTKRIVGVIVASAFFTPLLIMFIFVVNEFTNDKYPKNYETSGLVTII